MRISFENALRVEEEANGTVWHLLEPLIVEVGNEIWEVPADFRTDFASIPRVFRAVVPVLGRQNRPSVFHDWLYVEKPVSRRTADAWFYAGMQATGVGWLKRNAMWAAVRIGGGPTWQS